MVPSAHTDAPVACFELGPGRPSTATAVHFSDRSHDPIAVGIAWRVWDFGDGSTGVGSGPVHRYAAAGAYEVTLTLATFDGRVARVTKGIRVLGG